MRCVTSYFNPALFKKNLTRFWPLWGAYLFCGLCMTVLMLLHRAMDYGYGPEQHKDYVLSYALSLPEMLTFFVWVALFYAPMCAMAVYGYLYNHRASCGIHAMPLSRDTLYVTNFLSGAAFFVLPNLVITLATALTEAALIPGEDLGVALGKLVLVCAVFTGVEVFFFGFASVCAMVTGNILALPALYAIFNGLVVGIYELVKAWCSIIFYGVIFQGELNGVVEILTPIYKLLESCEYTRYGMVGEEWKTLPVEQQCLSSPGTVAAYAAAGLVLAGAGWLLYRRRHLETAGDVVAFAPLYPLFRVGVGVCAGLTGGSAMAAFFDVTDSMLLSTLFVLLWCAVGYFAAEMLLQKSFRVWKVWKGCAVVLCLCAGVCLAVQMDVLGIESRVPQPTQVEKVTISISPAYPDYEGDITTQDPAYIAAAVAIHQTIVDQRETLEDFEPWNGQDWEELAYVRLTYTLKDGTTLARSYNTLPIDRADLARADSLTARLEEVLSREDFAMQAYEVQELKETSLPVYGDVEFYRPDTDSWHSQQIEQDVELLWKSVEQDFRMGNLGQMSLFEETDRETGLRVSLSFVSREQAGGRPGASRYLGVTVTEKAVHTLSALELLGIPVPENLKS